MKTEVVMVRKLFDGHIRQKSKTGFLSANDLILHGNNWRLVNKLKSFSLNSWKVSKSTKEFIKEMKEQFGEVMVTTRGNNGGTWIHPYLFIDLALSISPKLKIEVYGWLYDELLKARNNSGDSYKIMTGALYLNCSNKSTFPKSIKKLANIIRLACGVKAEEDDWENATESQLKLRDKIHENIALLSGALKDNNQAIRIGIQKALDK